MAFYSLVQFRPLLSLRGAIWFAAVVAIRHRQNIRHKDTTQNNNQTKFSHKKMLVKTSPLGYQQ